MSLIVDIHRCPIPLTICMCCYVLHHCNAYGRSMKPLGCSSLGLRKRQYKEHDLKTRLAAIDFISDLEN